MACLRLILVCVLLLLPRQALSHEVATPQLLSPTPPTSVRKLTVVPVKPWGATAVVSFPAASKRLYDPVTDARISELEEELVLRCRLHGLDLYPAKWDGLAAIALTLVEYDRLLRVGAVRGSRKVVTISAGGSSKLVTIKSKLDDACRDLIETARARTVVHSIRTKTESVAFNKISLNTQPALARTDEIEEFFPWPPRWPTSRWPAAPDLFSDRDRFQTLANVNDFLREKLQEEGYDEYGYFKIKDTGFAIVTHLERINKKGEPDPAKRFDPSLKPTSSFNLAEYVYRLFLGATGHYRVFVFLFTPELVEPQPPSKQIEYSLAREWNQHGTDVLPPDLGALPVTAEHKLTVLVYEFIYREREKAPPYVLSSGGINPVQHLAATKIKLRP